MTSYTLTSAFPRDHFSASYLSGLLREPASRLSGLARLRTFYRPYICPMGWILSEIPKDARLYDIGCGSGVLLYLAKAVSQVNLAHGYDIDPGAVTTSQIFSYDQNSFRVECLPVESTPPNLSGYDVVTMIDVLHHIPSDQQRKFMQRVADNMAPGARLVFKDIDASEFAGSCMNQLHDLILARQWVHPLSRQESVRMLTEAGLSVLRHDTRWSLWYPHHLIVAEKPA